MKNSSLSAAQYAKKMTSAILRAHRNVKWSLAIATDIISCVIAVITSFSLRLGYWDVFSKPILIMVVSEIIFFLPIFLIGGVYANLLRFHGPRGLRQLMTCFFWLSLPTILLFSFIAIEGVPRTVSAIFLLIFFGLTAISRLLAKLLLIDAFDETPPLRNVLIYGAGSAGRQLADSLAFESNYNLVGYLEDDAKLVGRRLEGVRIYSSKDIENTISLTGAEIIFLAVPSLSRGAQKALIKRLQSTDIHVLTLPAISEIIDGKISISDLREIDVVDLLSRDPVKPDKKLMQQSIEGKVVLVTGAGGSIGSELARQIVMRGPKQLILVEMTESALYEIDMEVRTIAQENNIDIDIVCELASIEKKFSVRRIFAAHKPHTIYHAAAYKHVPLVEANIISGVSNNVRGTQYCAEAACAAGVERFILISTDKAVRPTNIMGASKRVCEMILQALAAEPDCQTIFSMVRFGNVLGSSGSVVPRFKKQIAEGGPVSITHKDITRYFMTIPEAAELVIQAGSMAKGGEVYLLEMGKPVKIMDLAKTMIRLSGLTLRDDTNIDGDIEIIETGLRPGEKLYEELLIDAEAHPTEHPRIFQATEAMMDWASLSNRLVKLDILAQDGHAAAIRSSLQELVPGFAPQIAEEKPASK